MTSRTCPMVARGSWAASNSPWRDSWHRLCSTQSPAGLRSGPTAGWLVFVNGPHRGEDMRLPIGKTTVGAAWNMDMVLTAPDIGSHHCNFVLSDDQATVTPTGPMRTVRVNGEAASGPVTLADGDRVSLMELDGVFRYAKAFSPGYRPQRARPSNAPVLIEERKTLTTLATRAWLVAKAGPCVGQDWRLVRGPNRFGSAMGLEVSWSDARLPAVACTFEGTAERLFLSSVHPQFPVFVNHVAVAAGATLEDSDQLRLGDTEFYVKCL